MGTPDAPWWERARCLGMAPLFDSEGDGKRNGRRDLAKLKEIAERQERAARVCAQCPVTAECDQDWQLGRDEGIRAGKVLPPIFKHARKAA
jgi:hypothetical protein